MSPCPFFRNFFYPLSFLVFSDEHIEVVPQPVLIVYANYSEIVPSRWISLN